MLELIDVANVATEFRAFELRMVLQFVQSLPNDLSVSISVVAPMWEFAEINAVSKHLVQILKEFALDLAVRAVHEVARLS